MWKIRDDVKEIIQAIWKPAALRPHRPPSATAPPASPQAAPGWGTDTPMPTLTHPPRAYTHPTPSHAHNTRAHIRTHTLHTHTGAHTQPNPPTAHTHTHTHFRPHPHIHNTPPKPLTYTHNTPCVQTYTHAHTLPPPTHPHPHKHGPTHTHTHMYTSPIPPHPCPHPCTPPHTGAQTHPTHTQSHTLSPHPHRYPCTHGWMSPACPLHSCTAWAPVPSARGPISARPPHLIPREIQPNIHLHPFSPDSFDPAQATDTRVCSTAPSDASGLWTHCSTQAPSRNRGSQLSPVSCLRAASSSVVDGPRLPSMPLFVAYIVSRF